MARRGQAGHSHRLVAERLASGTAMAAAVNDYLAAIGAKGFSPYTVAYRSRSLGHLVAWLAERGVDHPAEVTKPVLERYQRSLFHHPQGRRGAAVLPQPGLLSGPRQGPVPLVGADQPHPVQPGV